MILGCCVVVGRFSSFYGISEKSRNGTSSTPLQARRASALFSFSRRGINFHDGGIPINRRVSLDAESPAVVLSLISRDRSNANVSLLPSSHRRLASRERPFSKQRFDAVHTFTSKCARASCRRGAQRCAPARKVNIGEESSRFRIGRRAIASRDAFSRFAQDQLLTSRKLVFEITWRACDSCKRSRARARARIGPAQIETPGKPTAGRLRLLD